MPFNIDNYSTLPRNIGITTIKNRMEGVESFLKRNDKDRSINIESLKKKYYNQEKLNQTVMDEDNIERYMRLRREEQNRLTWRERWDAFKKQKLTVQHKGQSIYIWRSRMFEEVMFMYLPRFLFVLGSSYVIYQINLAQQKT